MTWGSRLDATKFGVTPSRELILVQTCVNCPGTVLTNSNLKSSNTCGVRPLCGGSLQSHRTPHDTTRIPSMAQFIAFNKVIIVKKLMMRNPLVKSMTLMIRKHMEPYIQSRGSGFSLFSSPPVAIQTPNHHLDQIRGTPTRGGSVTAGQAVRVWPPLAESRPVP